MKNFAKILGLAAVLVVAGCAEHRGCRSCNREPAPAPQPVYQAQPVSACGAISCGERTVREPVEVVYKRTTYRTVYEPKTTSAVSYEREAYRGGCAGAACGEVVQGGYYY